MQDDINPQANPEPEVPGPPSNIAPEQVPATPETPALTPSQPVFAEAEPPTNSFEPLQPVVQPLATNEQPPVSPFAETSQPVEPVQAPLSSEPVVVPGAMGSAKSPKKKRLIIAVIIVASLVALGGIGAAAYNLWYQNPDKVVTDGIIHALTAKSAKVTATSTTNQEGTVFGSSKIETMLTGTFTKSVGSADATFKVITEDKTHTVNGSFVYDKDANLYVKLEKLQELVTSTGLDAFLGAAATHIDGEWIKIPAAAAIGQKTDDKSGPCVKNALAKLESDKKVMTEIFDAYAGHRFIKVDEKLGSKDGSLGYVISEDEQASKAFAIALNNTTLFKDLQKCDKDAFTIDVDKQSEAADKSEKSRIELWVSRWSHDITQIKVTNTGDTSKSETIIKPIFNVSVRIETPQQSKSFEDVLKAIEESSTPTALDQPFDSVL